MKLTSILQFDVRLSERLRVAETPGWRRDLSVFFAHSGDSWFWGLGLILVWWLGNPFWKEWSILMLAGISVLAALVMAVKFMIRRRRPAGEWGSIYRNTDPHSFPSGHAARAFMIAIVAIGLGPLWAALVLVIWAPLVALARVAMGVHYVSDVVAGFVVGILMGLVVLQIHQPFLAWLTSLVHFPLW